MSPDDPTTVRPPTRSDRARRRAVSGLVALLAAAGTASALTTAATATAYAAPTTLTATTAPTATVTVDAGTSLGTMPSTGIGLNTAVYDPNMTDPAAASLMKAAGVQQLRYPGGSVGDGYHWRTHTLSGPGSWAAPGTDFDHFMAPRRRWAPSPS